MSEITLVKDFYDFCVTTVAKRREMIVLRYTFHVDFFNELLALNSSEDSSFDNILIVPPLALSGMYKHFLFCAKMGDANKIEAILGSQVLDVTNILDSSLFDHNCCDFAKLKKKGVKKIDGDYFSRAWVYSTRSKRIESVRMSSILDSKQPELNVALTLRYLLPLCSLQGVTKSFSSFESRLDVNDVNRLSGHLGGMVKDLLGLSNFEYRDDTFEIVTRSKSSKSAALHSIIEVSRDRTLRSIYYND